MYALSVLDELPALPTLTVAPTLNLNAHGAYNDPDARLITGAIARPFTPTPGSLGVNDTFEIIGKMPWDYDLSPKSWYEQRDISSGADGYQLERGAYLYTGYIPEQGQLSQIPTLSQVLASQGSMPGVSMDQTGLQE